MKNATREQQEMNLKFRKSHETPTTYLAKTCILSSNRYILSIIVPII